LTPVFLAVNNGNLNILQYMTEELELKDKIAKQKSKSEMNLLMIAA